MADELFDLRNAVALGNFHQAIAEGSQIKVTGRRADETVEIHAERDLLIARAQVGLGQADAVIADHKNASHPLLKIALAWASFNRALAHNDDADAAAAAKSLLALAGEKPAAGPAATAATIAGACLVHRGDTVGALQLCGAWADALAKDAAAAGAAPSVARQCIELRSIVVEALLRMHRVDVAHKVLVEMRQLDDDAVLTMLAGISVGVSLTAANVAPSSGESVDAKALLQDLAARCGQSPALLNIAGVAGLLAGSTNTCESSLVAALSKRSTDVDTLSNLAALAAALNKPADAFTRLCGQATSAGRGAPWPSQFADAQARFAEAARTFVVA